MLRCRVWGGGGEWREGRSRRFAVELGTGMYGMGGRGRRFAVPLEYGGASRRFAVSAEYGIPRGASLSRRNMGYLEALRCLGCKHGNVRRSAPRFRFASSRWPAFAVHTHNKRVTNESELLI